MDPNISQRLDNSNQYPQQSTQQDNQILNQQPQSSKINKKYLIVALIILVLILVPIIIFAFTFRSNSLDNSLVKDKQDAKSSEVYYNGKISYIKNGNIWVYNPDTKSETQLTFLKGKELLDDLDNYSFSLFSNELVYFKRRLEPGKYKPVHDLYFLNLDNGETKQVDVVVGGRKQVWYDKGTVLDYLGMEINKIDIKNNTLTEVASGYKQRGDNMKTDDENIYLGITPDIEERNDDYNTFPSEIIKINVETGEESSIAFFEGGSVDDLTFDIKKNNLVYVDPNTGIFYLTKDGNSPKKLFQEKLYGQSDAGIANIMWSPDGNSFAYLHSIISDDSSVWTQKLVIRNTKGELVDEVLPKELDAWTLRSYSWSPNSENIVVETYIEEDAGSEGELGYNQGDNLYIISLNGLPAEKIVNNAIKPQWLN